MDIKRYFSDKKVSRIVINDLSYLNKLFYSMKSDISNIFCYYKVVTCSKIKSTEIIIGFQLKPYSSYYKFAADIFENI